MKVQIYFYGARTKSHTHCLNIFLMSVLLTLCLFALSSTSALAANHYIRDGASGDGSDWNNAWDDLPTTFVRGDTYYVADGTYNEHTFSTAESGSTYIYIKKAIDSDHGTSTGWNGSYGDGQAVFILPAETQSGDIDHKVRFSTSYWVFDGQTGGGPGSWSSGHGFKVIPAAGADLTPADAKFELILLGNGWSSAPSYIQLSHIELTSPYRNKYDFEYGIFQNINCYKPYGSSSWDDANQGSQYITIDHCYIHDIGMMLYSVYAGYWTVEDNYFARNDVQSAVAHNQGEGWLDYGSDSMTVRYNIFEDIDGTANIAIKKNYAHNNYGWEIYGNIFWTTPENTIGGTGGNGVIGDTGDQGGPSATSNMKVYNNSFININANATINGWNAGIYFGASYSTNNKVYNNIWYNCRSRGAYDWFTGVDQHNYNWFYGNIRQGQNVDSVLAATETNAQVGTGNPFVNWQSKDFRLKSPTNRGTTLAAPYNTDLTGNTRGQDGTWDRGAYEYVGGQPAPGPQSPNADAGSDQTLTDSDENGIEDVNLNGSASTDPDGTIVSYEWWETVNGIPTTMIATGVNPTVSLSAGKHTIELKVTDNSGLTNTDTVVIIIESEPGLVGHWKFDEGSGTIASDSTKISDSGLLVNGPTWTAQGEINFDGSNDAVEVNTSDMTVNEGTVALWVYPKSFSKSRHILFGHTTIPSGNIIQLYCNASGMLGVGLGNNSALKTDIQALNTLQWYHVALTWNGTTYSVYVDGVQKATGVYSGLNTLQTYADIGNTGNRTSRTEGFDGLIDEVRLYDRKLDINEIADLALAFLPIDDKTASEGEEIGFSIRTRPGVIVDISDNNIPSIFTLASNVFSWTPDYDDAGTYQVEFTAPNGSGEDYEIVTFTVLDTQQEEPIGHWRFDETGGDIAYDSSTAGNNGYLKNGLLWDSGKINGALTFSVPNDAVEIQTKNFNNRAGTISMWVYVEKQTLSMHYLFGHANESLQNKVQLYLKYGNLCLGLGNNHETAKNIQLLQNQRWYHIVLTWNQTAYRVYVDGTSKALGTFPGLTGFAGHADIGNNGIFRDKGLNGKIDDVRIYNRALSVAEITELANK